MIKIPGMLLIGSAGPGCGKTEFACKVIKRFRKVRDIIAIKVTTISAEGLAAGQCPRGGKGCGVCSSLEGNFEITRETDSSGRKDTCRLLAAGASRVFWLRSVKGHLAEAAAALVEVIGADAISVCESNSLRGVAEPAAFVMLKRADCKSYKSSAKAVEKYADRTISFDGTGFDFDPARVSLVDGRWVVPLEAAAIILAGGPSRRMGTDKAMLPIGPSGESMIEHLCNQLRPYFARIIVSANDKSKYRFLGLEVVADRRVWQGPLMGIASALARSRHELNFVTACDIPQIDMDFVKRMLSEAKDYDVVMPSSGPSKYEPLFAVYKKETAEAMNNILAEGGLARQTYGGHRVVEIFSRCKVKHVDLAHAEWFVNINTKADYEEYRAKHDAEIRRGA